MICMTLYGRCDTCDVIVVLSMRRGTKHQTYSRRDGHLFGRDPKPTVNLVCTTVAPRSGLSMRPNLCCSPAL